MIKFLVNDMGLKDYENHTTIFKLANKEVESIEIKVLSGDEVATVKYIDGTSETFDANEGRSIDFVDGSYTLNSVYDFMKWMGRTNSYSYIR